jgi:hypothetical protein
MPTNKPLRLKRGRDEGEPREQLPPSAPNAGDVYGFLTSFTEGVQKGLDDTRLRDDS